jgi:hypothetical protein
MEGKFSRAQAKLNSPMRIPESLRAMGTEGFKISSLNEKHTNKNQQKQKSTKKIPLATGRNSNRSGHFTHQILMMSSLSSRLRLIFEWSVAAILQPQQERANAISSRRIGASVTRKKN